MSTNAAPRLANPGSPSPRSPGFGFEPHELPFDQPTAQALTTAVYEHAKRVAEEVDADTSGDLGSLLEHLERARDALESASVPLGPSPQVRAILVAFDGFLTARGHPDGADSIAKEATESWEDHDRLATALHGASYLAEWAYAGLRARLADR